MTRLPYGTFPLLSKEEQRKHIRERQRIYRLAHKKKINAYNKAYFDKWKETKPFVATCKRCKEEFNTHRKNIRLCPTCSTLYHERPNKLRLALIARRNAKAYLMDKVVELHNKGLLQAEIARELNLSQRNVSNYLLKMGIRTQKYYPRRK